MNTMTPKWNGPTKIVEAHELHTHTSSGWVLLESFETTESETVHEMVARMTPVSSGGYDDGSGTVNTNRTITVTKMQFLIGYERKSALADAAESKQKALSDKTVAEQDRDKAIKAREEAEKSLAQQIAGRESAAASSQTHRDQRDEECKLRRKLEDDMGKIRQAIGDRQWDEITKGA